MTTVIKLAGDIFYNASNVFSAGYELEAVTVAVEEVREKYRKTYEAFLKEPKKYYKQIQEEEEALLRLTEVEITRYTDVYKKLNEGPVTRIYEKMANLILGVDFDKRIDIKEWVDKMHSTFVSGLTTYYSIYIAPYE